MQSEQLIRRKRSHGILSESTKSTRIKVVSAQLFIDMIASSSKYPGMFFNSQAKKEIMKNIPSINGC